MPVRSPSTKGSTVVGELEADAAAGVSKSSALGRGRSPSRSRSRSRSRSSSSSSSSSSRNGGEDNDDTSAEKTKRKATSALSPESDDRIEGGKAAGKTVVSSSSSSSSSSSAAAATATATATASSSPTGKQRQEEEEKPKISKRQRRKLGPNPSNTWPQHPKIQSREVRDRAYLRVAGLLPDEDGPDRGNGGRTTMKTGKKRRTKMATTTRNAARVMAELEDADASEVKFGRLLGSADQRVRHAAVRQLEAYLRARCRPAGSTSSSPSSNDGDVGGGGGGGNKNRRAGQERDPNDQGGNDDASVIAETNIGQDGHGPGISELDLLKLWKALWFTLYMCDKVPVQQELSKRLSKLIWCVAGTEEEDAFAAQAYLDLVHSAQENEAEETDYDQPDNDKEEDTGSYDDDDNDDHQEKDGTAKGGGHSGRQHNNDFDVDDDGDEDEDNSDDDDEEEVDDWEVPHCRGAHLASLFLKTFFVTIRQEWGSMDKYRIDKFYSLIRYSIHEVFSYMALRHWNLGLIRLFNDILLEEVLMHTPNGLRFHLIDLMLDELANVNTSLLATSESTEATIMDVLEPYLVLAQSCHDKVVQARVMDGIFGKFLFKYSVVSDAAVEARSLQKKDKKEKKNNSNDRNPSSSAMSPIFDQVHVSTVADHLFELASDPCTLAQHHESLYNMYKTYKKRLKMFGYDVEPEGTDTIDEDMVEEVEVEMEDKDEKGNKTVHDQKPELKVREGEAKHATKMQKATNEQEDSGKAKEKEEVVGSTKKKRKKESLEENPMMENSNEDDASSSSAEPAKKKQKKKKKKKKISNEDEAQPPIKEAEKAQPPIKEAEKAAKGDEEETKCHEIGGEVLTISMADQKDAQLAMQSLSKKKKTKTRKEEDDSNNNNGKVEMESPRRVKFGSINQSKSYKASMRDLKKADPKLEAASPERGILKKASSLSSLQRARYHDDKTMSFGKKKKRRKK